MSSEYVPRLPRLPRLGIAELSPPGVKGTASVAVPSSAAVKLSCVRVAARMVAVYLLVPDAAVVGIYAARGGARSVYLGVIDASK